MTQKSQTVEVPSSESARVHGAERFEDDSDLLRRTMKTSLVLVVACVLFVGSLSAGAFFVTSRAFGSSQPSAEARPAHVETAETAKKPLSI